MPTGRIPSATVRPASVARGGIPLAATVGGSNATVKSRSNLFFRREILLRRVNAKNQERSTRKYLQPKFKLLSGNRSTSVNLRRAAGNRFVTNTVSENRTVPTEAKWIKDSPAMKGATKGTAKGLTGFGLFKDSGAAFKEGRWGRGLASGASAVALGATGLGTTAVGLGFGLAATTVVGGLAAVELGIGVAAATILLPGAGASKIGQLICKGLSYLTSRFPEARAVFNRGAAACSKGANAAAGLAMNYLTTPVTPERFKLYAKVGFKTAQLSSSLLNGVANSVLSPVTTAVGMTSRAIQGKKVGGALQLATGLYGGFNFGTKPPSFLADKSPLGRAFR